MLRLQSKTTPPPSKPSQFYPEYSANAALALINVACFLLDQKIKKLADNFMKAVLPNDSTTCEKQISSKTKAINQI